MIPSESTHCGRFFPRERAPKKLFGVLLFFSALLLHAGSCRPCSASFPRSSVCRRVMTAGGAAPCRDLPRPPAPRCTSPTSFTLAMDDIGQPLPVAHTAFCKSGGRPSPAPQSHPETAPGTAAPIPPRAHPLHLWVTEGMAVPIPPPASIHFMITEQSLRQRRSPCIPRVHPPLFRQPAHRPCPPCSFQPSVSEKSFPARLFPAGNGCSLYN